MDRIQNVIKAVQDIYYAFWAEMLDWKIYQRAMLVLLLTLFLIWVFICIGGRLLGLVVKFLGRAILRFFYGLWQNFSLMDEKKGEQSDHIYKMNQISAGFRKADEKLEHIGKVLSGNRGGKLRYYIMAYLVCIFFVGVPDILQNHVNNKYLTAFSVGQSFYCKLESGTLEKARNYEPLFQKNEEYIIEDSETESEENTEKEDVTWFKLTDEAIVGSNIRSGPGMEYESIGVLSGEVKLKYVEEMGKWVCVELENGEQGWVNKKLIEEVE